jgi:starch phosphorylase
VPAGHDRFPPDLARMLLWPLQKSLRVDWTALAALGREHPDDPNEWFCMTTLAMKAASHINAVSQLHAEVTREMWGVLWGGRALTNEDIGFVTNGVHVETFLHDEMRQLFEREGGPRWRELLLDDSAWAAMVSRIGDAELVRRKRKMKRDLLAFMRDRQASEVTVAMRDATAGWSDRTLTIGFARRFATYKRAALLLSDMDRAAAIFGDPDRPVQIIFAGKAHPQDEPGKRLIQSVIEAARDPRLRGRIAFIENYDLAVARAMTSGVDVWLNTPRRPREASGTSGQKVPFHAGVNCSILDGWWAEGFNGENGFAIGDLEVPANTDEQDARDGAALYHTFEQELIPRYYADGRWGESGAWVGTMRSSLATLPARFSTDRMLRDYVTRYYLPKVAV